MLTKSAEQSYQDKLFNLGQRYDELKARCVKLELGEIPPVQICELLGKAVYHLGTAKRYYNLVIAQHPCTPQAQTATTNLVRARECEETFNWILKIARVAVKDPHNEKVTV